MRYTSPMELPLPAGQQICHALCRELHEDICQVRMGEQVLTVLGQAIGNSSMNLPDTDVRASSGHGRNQSMVQPLIRPGNCRARRAKCSPTGLKHRQTCSWSRTRARKKLYRLSYVSMVPTGSSKRHHVGDVPAQGQRTLSNQSRDNGSSILQMSKHQESIVTQCC